MLNELLEKLNALSPEEKQALIRETSKATAGMSWIPSPGPQTEAYFCPADLLLYGGQGGGGKSALLLGLALTAHRRSLIMRRQFTDLNALTEEALKFNGTRDGFNGASPPRLRTSVGGVDRLIEFGAAALPGSEQSWMGQAHDLLGFDEAVHFLESQVRLLMGWVRSTEPGQRTRTVMATNPPTRAEGQWIIGMFRPWLDITHPNPAKHGELRWYVRYPDGTEGEVPDATPIEIDGEVYKPMSRTFIHAALKDNPFLVDTNYQASLDALEEPLRSAIRDGNFMAARRDDVDQLIPTDWLYKAQRRWEARPPANVPMCAIGVDVAQGGADNTVLAIRHDGWFAPLLVVPGKETPGGHEVAGLVVSRRRDNALVVLDMGGGYGGAALEHLRGNGVNVLGYKGSTKTSRSSGRGAYKFHNTRAAAYWAFREALDPTGLQPSTIALPDDPELLSELSAHHFEIDSRGIKIKETKEQIKDILGRSPDKADAVVMAWWAGDKNIGTEKDWIKHSSQAGRYNRQPQVIRKLPKRMK